MDCIAVGTAITYAAGQNNKSQHGQILARKSLLAKSQEIQQEIQRKFVIIPSFKSYIESLIGNKEALDIKGINFDKKFSIRLGLPMFIELMDYLQLPRIIVSSTSLWYGIYYEHLMKMADRG